MVIPVHGNWDVTERCLESLRDRDACIRRVIVVDDASPDDTAVRLQARTDVHAVTLMTNRGFAAACNAGAAAGNSDVIFFLNNDTLVPPSAIDRLAAVLEDDPSIGAVGPRLLYADGTIQSAGGSLMAADGRVGRIYTYLDGDLPEANVAGDYFGVSGGAFMVRRDDFTAAGRFNEAYLMGFEDVELCLELWRHGRRIRYVPDVTIVHLEGVGRGKTVDDARNGALFASRWAGKLDTIPRFAYLGEPPCLAVSWHDRSPVDALVRAELGRSLAAYAGARVSFVHGAAGSAIAAIRARLDGRALVRIGYGSVSRADVRWCAPRDASDAARISAAKGSEPLWVPSRGARALLIAAGVPAERVRVTHLGFAPTDPSHRRPSTAIVTNGPQGAARAEAIRRAIAPHDAFVIDADACDAAAFARLRSATHAIVDGGGDAWGLLGGTALAHGAVVIAPCDAAFVESLPDDAYVGTTAAALAETAREVVHNAERYAAVGIRARKETMRRLPDVYTGHRVRELARAHVFGIPPPSMVEFTPRTAATLRERPLARGFDHASNSSPS